MASINPGQQKRIRDKIVRNLAQILKTTDGLTVTSSLNAVNEWDIAVAAAGAWATTTFYALIKIQEMPISSFPVTGYPVNKLMVCVEGDASVRGTLVDAGLLAEVLCRLKDLGCAVELYLSATTVQPADQATDGGTFNAGAATLKRHVRASVDTLGMGQ